MDVVEDILSHHGVKGMKWGVRKDNPGGLSELVARGKSTVKTEVSQRTASEVTARNTPGKGVRTVGGQKRLAHPDAIDARTSQQVAKKSTLDALSTPELQRLVTRMNLESQYNQLAAKEPSRVTKGEEFANNLLDSAGAKAATKIPGSSKAFEMAIEETKKRVI